MITGLVAAANFKFSRFEAASPKQHSGNMPAWDSHYEQLAPGDFHGSYSEAWLGPLQIFVEDIDSPYTWKGHAWNGSRVFFSCFPQTGTLYCDNREVSNTCLTTHRWSCATRRTCKSDYHGIYAVVDESAFDQYTESVMDKHYFKDFGDDIMTSNKPDPGDYFRASLHSLLVDVAQNPHALATEHGRHAFMHRGLDALVETLELASGTSSPLPPPSTRAYIVDKAIEIIESEISEPLALGDLCKAIRICPRTLRYSFENVLGMSPTKYILYRRLVHARADLQNSGGKELIERIALRWGFWHMGRFSQNYKRYYGETPSQTIAGNC